MKETVRVLIVVLLVTGPTSRAWAQQTPAHPRDLAGATLEELLNIRVTSAARKQQRAEDVPAAIFVITQDDIQRSGLRTLPEIFRLVPGMQVAQINANKWAVSVRGFNDLYSNKLLVLIDGRSIYNRAFSGVLWDGQDLMIADIDRIEVIRGPGGAVWGANAVNGIVNIITRSAAETKGTALDVSLGTLERDRVSVRYGGSLGKAAYRVYSQWSEYGNALSMTAADADDRWRSLITGFRTDWTHGRDEFMAQGNISDSVSRPNWLALSSATAPTLEPTRGESDIDELTILGRWTRTGSTGAVFKMQAFHVTASRDDLLFWSREQTSDLDAQYQRALGSHHDVVVGGGVRHAGLATRKSFTLDIGPGDNDIFNAFVQDEIKLGHGVTAMFGSKLEHDTTGGWGFLPSASVLWQLSSNQRLWGGVSRARRTPSSVDRELQVYVGTIPGGPLPILVGYTGNLDFRSEELVQGEVGYRLRAGSSAEVEVTAFRGSYDHARTAEPFAPVLKLASGQPHLFVGARADNLLRIATTGVEINGRWAPSAAWRLDGSYSALNVSPHPYASSQDVTATTFDGNAPTSQWQLHSSTWLTPRALVDASFYRVGRLRELAVPAYSRVDARFEFKLNRRVSVIATGQNLSSARHQEFSGLNNLMQASAIPRSGRLQLRWQF